jgi:Ca2+-binding EF-hand superfamily protein
MSAALSKILGTNKSIEEPLDYNPIYKINYLVNGSINSIIVFYGQPILVGDEEKILRTIFTEKEIDNIHTKKIQVKFTEQKIHYDDSISTIKIKIVIELKKHLRNSVSLDEVYLFCRKTETLNAISLYQSLTQNKKLELTRVRLKQFISNIVSYENGKRFNITLDKETYTFDDILEMKLEGKKCIVNKVLGQKFFIVENEYPFVCNPYDVTEYDRFFERNSRKSLSTLNSHLLLNSGEIFNKNIYLCLAGDVLEFASENSISEETTVKTYYPFLFSKDILSLDDLKSEGQNLLENDKKTINEKTADLFKTIDMFYDVYNLKTTDLKYVSKGIKYIKAIIKPEFDINIPLEIIFKIIHATENSPLIKYNPSTRQENIYRLYTDKISTDGRKIPYLKKAIIFKLMKTIAKSKSVSVYIETKQDETMQTLVCEFDENGYITISCDFDTIVDENEIDALFRDSINPIISEIKNLLQQSGYNLKLFNSLYDDNIEIKQLNYVSQIKISKQVELDSYKGCISSVFNNESSEFKSGIHLRFKRVSNFSKVSSQEAFILEKSGEGYRGSEIIDALLANYPDDLTRAQAEDLVRKVANEIQVERGVRKTDIKIKNNPGFKTTIALEQKIGVITITVENINDIHYLQTIPVYLDTIIRLTQNKNSTTYPVKEIDRLCSSGEKDEVIIEDIISSTEKSIDDGEEVASLEPEEDVVDYKKYTSVLAEKPKGALSLFFDEDEFEDMEPEEGGGGTPSSSEESLQSDIGSPISSEESVKSDKITPSSSSEESIQSDKSLQSFGVSSSEEVESPKDITLVESSSEEVESPKDLIVSPVISSSEEVVVEPVVESSSEEVESPKESSSEEVVVEPVVESSSEEVVESPKIEEVVESPKEIIVEPVISSSEEVVESPKVESSPEIVVESPKVESSPEIVVESPIIEERVPAAKSDSTEELSSAINKAIEVSKADVNPESLSEESAGEEEEEDYVRNIDGLKLNKPYYFQTLIENKDPVLILKEDSAEYNAYSRTCRSDTRRQPVIITDAQLEKINREHKGFLRDEDVIKYGSDENKQFNYICPRYWCLKNNTIVDPADLVEVKGKDGKTELQHPTCGKVIPRDAKEVKPGHYIYEFYEPEHKTQEKYEKSFRQSDKNGDGLISFDEFKKLLRDLKEDYNEKIWAEHYNKMYGKKPSPPQIAEFVQKQELNMRKMFDFEDKNKDNMINLAEFINITTPRKYPGLIPDKHPKGLCLPCCFDKYNTEGRIFANQKCFDDNEAASKKGKKQKLGKKVVEEAVEKVEEEEEEEKKPKIMNKDQDDYIKGPDKFPLTPGRWGYLPIGIQKILQEVNADCQISKTNTNIKPNHPCLLRHGIEVNKKQSFVACISDILNFNKVYKDEKTGEKKFRNVLSIKDMRERLLRSITIDTFVTYQNGNLVSDFYNMKDKDKINVEKYKTSTLFSKLNIDNPNDLYYMKKVVSAFENFGMFLSDDDVVIDHTYLWDIISIPNKDLFPRGANIVIFQIPNDDITNNVQIICPTNHYSKEFYNSDKSTIIMMKEDGYYEPIYSYTIKEKLDIVTLFEEGGSKMSPTMKRVMNEIIKPFFNTICRPLESMPNVYKAKRALTLPDLYSKLNYYDYTVKQLVLNFNSKVIGVVAEEPKTGREGFIPCYPSSVDDSLKDIDTIYMTDLSIWKSYNTTVKFLDNLEKRTKKKRTISDIPCKPVFKVVEDEWVVGILTETNQFIQLSQPVTELDANDDYELESIKNDNYIINKNINKDTTGLVSIDLPITTQNDYDEERADYIKKTKMETGFYNVFRNTIRILLNDYENVKMRSDIENELAKDYIIYSEKLKNVYDMLVALVNNVIQFTGNKDYYKLIEQISTCVVKSEDECDAMPNLCTFTKKGRCNLILPRQNLVTEKDNKPIYFRRMADELIRYNRINSFMFQPQTYLSFGNIGYNLNDTEIIMIQSLLTQEYFETFVPAVINKYTRHNSYDEAEPSMSQLYDNTASRRKTDIAEEICEAPKTNDNITSGIWKKCFPSSYKEVEYSKSVVCTFQFVIDLIEKHTGVKLSLSKIRNELFSEYKQYLDKYHDKIVDILIIEGKKLLGKEYNQKVKSDKINFLSFISAENYFLTTLDLWLLVQRYKIPTIFISQNCILQTKYEKRAFLGYGDENQESFAFILLPGLRDENIPNYKLVQSDTGDVFISLTNIKCREKIREIIGDNLYVETYLDDFTKHSKTNYQLKTKCKDDDLGELEDVEKPKKVKTKAIVVEEEKEEVEAVIEKPKQSKQSKKKKESGEKNGTRKRCPKGTKRNKDGICE